MSTKPPQVITLDIGEDIRINMDVALNEYIDSYTIIELQSDDYFIKDFRVFGEEKSEIFGYSTDGEVMAISLDGKLKRHFNYVGRAFGEYLRIASANLDVNGKEIVIHDLFNKIVRYSYQGGIIGEVTGETVKRLGDVCPDGKGNYTATLYPSPNIRNKVVIIDTLSNILREYFPVSDFSQTNDRGLIYIEDISIGNSIPTYCPTVCDTLFAVSIDSVSPLFAINQGNLFMPEKLRVQVGKDNEKSKYIDGLYGKIAGHYFFASYYYEMKMYYDLWDLRDGKRVIHRDCDDDDSEEGFLFVIDGKSRYVWPQYVNDNVIYCVMDYSSYSGSTAYEDENRNPVLLVLTLTNQ